MVPPSLCVGDAIDVAALSATLEEIGYVIDDRVDEPGEMAVRGDVIDIFPADAGLPARIEIAAGRIGAIRGYDPVTQRSAVEIERLEVGRAAEPASTNGVSILAHLAPGCIVWSDRADKRRRRFVQLACDAAKRGGGTVDAVDDADWSVAIDPWRMIEFGDPGGRAAVRQGAIAAGGDGALCEPVAG